MTLKIELSPAEHSRRVIAQTVSAWKIAPASPHEVARRAPHGHVPIRMMRRLRAAALAYGRPALGAETAANDTRLEDALTQGLRWAI
ncbi:hypothetical protein [Variovorax saccharolyticus]|uniref:hypothetical protein n=1 Tax=Variovorax saccharolyticus TaxID=3053516 RepID=UPI002575697F|nr:hypothetical protein [Variovorax sp. J22R187]MDM0021457.1 hypothetical protein [Variovorax sp. J22R187]